MNPDYSFTASQLKEMYPNLQIHTPGGNIEGYSAQTIQNLGLQVADPSNNHLQQIIQNANNDQRVIMEQVVSEGRQENMTFVNFVAQNGQIMGQVPAVYVENMGSPPQFIIHKQQQLAVSQANPQQPQTVQQHVQQNTPQQLQQRQVAVGTASMSPPHQQIQFITTQQKVMQMPSQQHQVGGKQSPAQQTYVTQQQGGNRQSIVQRTYPAQQQSVGKQPTGHQQQGGIKPSAGQQSSSAHQTFTSHQQGVNRQSTGQQTSASQQQGGIKPSSGQQTTSDQQTFVSQPQAGNRQSTGQQTYASQQEQLINQSSAQQAYASQHQAGNRQSTIQQMGATQQQSGIKQSTGQPTFVSQQQQGGIKQSTGQPTYSSQQHLQLLQLQQVVGDALRMQSQQNNVNVQQQTSQKMANVQTQSTGVVYESVSENSSPEPDEPSSTPVSQTTSLSEQSSQVHVATQPQQIVAGQSIVRRLSSGYLLTERDPNTGEERVYLQTNQSMKGILAAEPSRVTAGQILRGTSQTRMVKPQQAGKPVQQYRAKRAPQQQNIRQPMRTSSPAIIRHGSPARVQSPSIQEQFKQNILLSSAGGSPAGSPGSHSPSGDEHMTPDLKEQLGKIAEALPTEERGNLSRFMSAPLTMGPTPAAAPLQPSLPQIDAQLPVPVGMRKGQPRAPRPPKQPKLKKPPIYRKPREPKMTKKQADAALKNETVLLVPNESFTQLLQTFGVEGAENAYADIGQSGRPPSRDNSQQSDQPEAQPLQTVHKSTAQVIRTPVYMSGQGVRGGTPRGPRPVMIPVTNTPNRPQNLFASPQATTPVQIEPTSTPIIIKPNKVFMTMSQATAIPGLVQTESTGQQPQKTKIVLNMSSSASPMPHLQTTSRLPQMSITGAQVQQAINQRFQKPTGGNIQQITVGGKVLHPGGESQPVVIHMKQQQQGGATVVAKLTDGQQLFQQQRTMTLARSLPSSQVAELQPMMGKCSQTSVEETMAEKTVLPPVKEDEPPRYIPGFAALCPSCGIASLDFNRCQRCRRKLPGTAKKVKSDALSTPVARPTTIDKPPEEKKPEKPEPEVDKRKLKVWPRKKKFEEPEVLVLSSDDESEKPNDNSGDKLPGVDKEPIYSSSDMTDGCPLNICDDSGSSDTEEEQYTSMLSTWCRIGNYRSDIRERVIISKRSIRFKILSPEDQHVMSFSIKWANVIRMLWHCGTEDPVIFLYLQLDVVKALRKRLGMDSHDFPYQYNPISDVESYKRLIISLEKITDENKLVVNDIVDKSRLQELSDQEVLVLLALSTAPIPDSPAILPNNRVILNFENMAITIGDYKCLAHEVYLNDVIMDFYLAYLWKRILSPEDRARTHIFSTYFYNRLTKKLEKECSKDSPAEKRHKRVRRWTKKTNLFEKDFIVIPINENSHWFLALICFPNLTGPVSFEDGSPIVEPTVPRKVVSKPVACLQIGNTTITQFKAENGTSVPITLNDPNPDRDEAEATEDDLEDDVEEGDGNVSSSQPSIPLLGADHEPSSSQTVKKDKSKVPIKQPCILIFDSLRGSGNRARVVATLRDFLKIEYNYRTKKTRDFNKDNCKGTVLKVPQQDNFSDCGLYVLHYVERFFSTPLPDYRLPIRYLQNWFTEDYMKNKRVEVAGVIQHLIAKEGRNLETMNLPIISQRPRTESSEEEEDCEEELEEEEDDEDFQGTDCIEEDYVNMETYEEMEDEEEEINEEEEDDDVYGVLEPGEIRRPRNIQTTNTAHKFRQDEKLKQSVIEQSKASPVSEQERTSLKNIRIQRSDRRTYEPVMKKSKHTD